MAVPPAVRAIRAAIASNDLDNMRRGLAMGEHYSFQLEQQAQLEAKNPPPPPAEGEPEPVSAAVLLAEVTGSLEDLRRAIARAEKELRDKKGGPPAP